MKTEASEYMALLQEIQNQNVLTLTTVPTDEPRFIIETNSRTIGIPSEFPFLSVQYDHKAETIYFEIDRYFDDTDLSQHTCVVQFINKNGSQVYEGTYPVTTMDINSIEGKIIFGWEVCNNATQLVGDIAFSIRFYSLDENGNFTYNFNTLPAHSNILETLNVSHSNNQITISDLEIWTAKINTLISSVEGNVQKIERHIGTIPDDYNGLLNDFVEFKEELAKVFQSVSNGKELIASAISDKGVRTSKDATFNTMANNIAKIDGGGEGGSSNNEPIQTLKSTEMVLGKIITTPTYKYINNKEYTLNTSVIVQEG